MILDFTFVCIDTGLLSFGKDVFLFTGGRMVSYKFQFRIYDSDVFCFPSISFKKVSFLFLFFSLLLVIFYYYNYGKSQ